MDSKQKIYKISAVAFFLLGFFLCPAKSKAFNSVIEVGSGIVAIICVVFGAYLWKK